MFEWTGAEDAEQQPWLAYAHMDVVPCPNAGAWAHPPFDGVVAPDPRTGEPCVWGRGAIDLKNMCCGWLEAIEDLLAQGFAPRRTLFLALGHDEEIGGLNGAREIAKWLVNERGLPERGAELTLALGSFEEMDHPSITSLTASRTARTLSVLSTSSMLAMRFCKGDGRADLPEMTLQFA